MAARSGERPAPTRPSRHRGFGYFRRLGHAALYASAILNGLAAPPLILLMLILANAPWVKRKSGWLSNGLMIVALAIMTACAVAYTIGWFVVG